LSGVELDVGSMRSRCRWSTERVAARCIPSIAAWCGPRMT